MHFLRHGLGAGVLTSRGTDEVGLDAMRLWCDAADFEVALAAGDLERALELYRGDLLPGFFVSEAPEFERWLEDTRRHARTRAAEAAWLLAAREETGGDRRSAVRWGRRAVVLAPDDEGALRRLLELHLRLGDRPGALRAYEEFVGRLKRDFDVEPSAETQAVIAVARQPTKPALPTRTIDAPTPSAPAAPPASATAGRLGAGRQRPGWMAPAAAVAAIVLAFSAILAGSRRRPGVTPVSANTVVVFPFNVRGSSEFDYLREGMVDLLSAKLQDAAGLHAVDPRAVLAALRREPNAGAAMDPARARRLADGLGAGLSLAGDIVEIAGRLHVSGALYQRGRRAPVASATAEGEASRLFELVDELAVQLLGGRAPARDSALVRLASITTTSLPALKRYLEGEAAFRAGLNEQAVEAFQRAVALDSTFALATYRLATAASWTDHALRDRVLAATARHADRLPPLMQRLFAAFRSYAHGDAVAAESQYQAITRVHPDNVEAWFMLAETQFHYNGFRGRPFTASRAAFERVERLESNDPHAILHLARIAAAEGRSGGVDSLATRFLARYPDADGTLELRTLRAFATTDTVEQQRVRGALRTARDLEVQEALGSLAMYNERLAEVAMLAPLFALPGRNPDVLEWGHVLVGQAAAVGGRRGPIVSEPAELTAVEPRWPLEVRALAAAAPFSRLAASALVALRDSVARRSRARGARTGLFAYEASLEREVRDYLAGLLSARLADSVAARASATSLERLGQARGTAGIGQDLAHSVRASLAWAQGNPRAALTELQQFRFDPPPPPIFWMGTHERFLRAELLQALGRDAEALEWYSAFTGGLNMIHLAPAHLRQAQISQRLGKHAEAIHHYARFIDLWRDCDPELRPQLEEARRALAGLQSTH